MGYYRMDVVEAEKRICAEVPNVQIDRFDFGFGLRVKMPGAKREFVVFQPQRDELGQREIIGDVDDIIRQLKVGHRG